MAGLYPAAASAFVKFAGTEARAFRPSRPALWNGKFRQALYPVI
jgi:hypothetical protein